MNRSIASYYVENSLLPCLLHKLGRQTLLQLVLCIFYQRGSREVKAGRGLGRTNRQNVERVWLNGKTGHRG